MQSINKLDKVEVALFWVNYNVFQESTHKLFVLFKWNYIIGTTFV
jgi:hypothetical protein